MYRQAVWGFSNGVLVLGVGGAFWFSLALGQGFGPMASAGVRPFLIGIAAVMCLGFGLILRAGVQIRHKAPGFRLAEARRGDQNQRLVTQRISRGFFLVGAGQLGAVALAVLLSSRFERRDLILPVIGLMVGVHFIPLAALLGVRLYYWTGALSSAVAVVALIAFDGPAQSAVLGAGIGAVLWGTTFYLIRHADEMARATYRSSLNRSRSSLKNASQAL